MILQKKLNVDSLQKTKALWVTCRAFVNKIAEKIFLVLGRFLIGLQQVKEWSL